MHIEVAKMFLPIYPFFFLKEDRDKSKTKSRNDPLNRYFETDEIVERKLTG